MTLKELSKTCKIKKVCTECEDIISCIKLGLKAISNRDRNKIQKRLNLKGKNINCSINLDSCLETKYLNKNRWDYIIQYGMKHICVEVHPITAKEIKVIIGKLNWLLSLSCVKKLDKKELVLISPNGVKLNLRSREAKQLALHGIKINRI